MPRERGYFSESARDLATILFKSAGEVFSNWNLSSRDANERSRSRNLAM